MRWMFMFVLLGLCFNLSAQNHQFPKSNMAVVVENNNQHTIGSIISNTLDKITLLVNGKDEREFYKSSLKFYKVLDQNDLVLKGKYMFPTTGQTNYLYSSSAYTLDTDRLAYQLSGIYSEFQIPVSSTIDVGLGTFAGAPLSISVKKRVQIGSSLNIGIKGYAVWASYFEPSVSGFAGQLLVTNGSKERNITIGPGVGVGVADREIIGVLFSTFGLKARISQKYSLVAEGMFGREFESNYFLGIFSGMVGAHYHTKRNIIWSGGIGTGGFQQINFNFWGKSSLDTTFFPMIYGGFRKTWVKK
ncbi:MAG: hypothetical protein JKY54_03015 [Flavobacteriales bacterium]|nr:hypothetical protein [Flavobacteriales bacterium]